MEQNDNDADIVKSLLFLMDSNIETKNENNDFKEDGVLINLGNASKDYLPQGYFAHEYAQREVGLDTSEIDRESEKNIASPESTLPVFAYDNVPDPAHANSGLSICSLSVAVCSLEKDKSTISLHRDKRGDSIASYSP
jgi:hypothetical protein